MIKIIKPQAILMTEIDPLAIYKHIELCGRTCYKSEEKQTDTSHEVFIKNLIKRNHLSVLEHVSLSFKIVCSRACSHQLVRHRISSFSQESQRFISYEKKGELKVICPDKISQDERLFEYWKEFVDNTYSEYCYLVKCGLPPEDARSILPNCCATEISTTMNIRSFRHFISVRTDKHAQEEIKNIANQILTIFQDKLPLFVSDLQISK